MKKRESWIVICLAAAGMGACATAVAAFILDILYNNLAWHPGQTAQEHYLAVGNSYSEGFAIGFFLCFFLSLAAVGAGQVLARRRALRSPVASDDPQR